MPRSEILTPGGPIRRRLATLIGPAAVSYLAAVALGAVGALALAAFLGSATYHLGPTEISLTFDPLGSGWTQLRIPPAGTVDAHTHWGPVDLEISLKRVDLEGLTGVLTVGELGMSPWSQMAEGIPDLIRTFAVRLLILGLMGGVIGARLGGWRCGRRLSAGAMAGVLVIGFLLGVTALTYDASAFENPRYTGVLTAAPAFMDVFSGSALELEGLDRRLMAVGDNLNRLFGGLEDLQPLGADSSSRRVLVVADLHNNPVGISFISSLVRTFGADMVLDAGDVTDYGTVLEADLVAGIGQMGVPYVIAMGNHDSPVIREQLEPYSDVHFLTGSTVTVKGIPILGSSDPAAYGFSPSYPDKSVLEDQVHQLARGLLSSEVEPFFLVAHHPEVSRRFLGQVPVVVAGHTHRVTVKEEGGSLYLNPGSAGSSGIRGLDQMAGDEYAALLVHMVTDEEAEGRLSVGAVDIITFSPETRTLRLERRPVEVEPAPGLLPEKGAGSSS